MEVVEVGVGGGSATEYLHEAERSVRYFRETH